MKRTPEEQSLKNEQILESKNLDIRANGTPVVNDMVGIRCKHYDNVSSYCGVLMKNIDCGAKYGSGSCKLGTFQNEQCQHKNSKYETKSVSFPFGISIEYWKKSCRCGYALRSFRVYWQ